MVAAEALQDIAPAEKCTGVGVGDNHFAGTKAGTLSDARFFEIDESGFRANDEQAVVRHCVAHGAEAVAIEFGADVLAIGKNQRCRAIPRFALLRESSERAANIARE